MATYGRTTVGGSFVDIEVDVQARNITLVGGEAIVATWVYLRTTNSSTANVKSVLYNTSEGLVYESNQLSFTDDVGGWKTITWPSTTPTAGTYRLSVGGGFISGGTNTVEIASDTVAASVNFRRAAAAIGGAQSSYPTFPNPITWDGADDTHDVSLYLETGSGSSGIPRFMNVYSRRRRGL
jgi:hypothetical protein